METATHPGTSWAIRLPPGGATAAGALRLRPGVEVHTSAEAVWLRGPDLTDELDLALRKIPGAERFRTDTDGRTTPVGARLPTARLPRTGWQALRTYLAPAPQPAALGGTVAGRVAVELVRDEREAEPSVVVTTVADWAAYAVTAPRVRLTRLRVAAAADGRVLVRGTPVPPVPGVRCVDRGGVVVPCGWAWTPAVDPPVLRAALGLAEGDLALLADDGTHEVIPAAALAPATRSGARQMGVTGNDKIRMTNDE